MTRRCLLRCLGLALALALLVSLPVVATAADGPAGMKPPEPADPTGRALGIPQIVLLVLFAALALYTANWVFIDTKVVDTDETVWDLLVLGGALAGVAVAMLVPMFVVGLPLGLVLFGGAAGSYVFHRNSKVPVKMTVLTAAHIQRLKDRMAGRTATATGGPVTGVGRDIIFMGLDDLPVKMEAANPDQARANGELERILFKAIQRDAGLVGLVVKGGAAQVRERIDGQVVDAGKLAQPVSGEIAAAVKRLVGLDPTESRKPQKGRVRAVVEGKSYELRVRTSGSVRGEQIVIRIIDIETARMRLDEIGLTDRQQERIGEALKENPGMVIVSGPKDSGLTTTLHACLRHYDRYMNNVIALEPRIDLEVENVKHLLLNEQEAEAAAAEVAEQLRTEPDIVAVDSLSTPEVASALVPQVERGRVLVGIRAGGTGQAVARVARLIGSTDPLAEGLRLAVNQRLVRKLCPECKEAYRPNPDFLRKANLASSNVDVLYRPPSRIPSEKGKPTECPRCQNRWYVGRAAIFEVLPIDDEARRLLREGASVADLRAHARKLGMRNLQEQGLRLVTEGVTSVDEVLRATKKAK